jgi:hypothetical protein
MAWNEIEKVLWFGTWSSGLARFKDGKISYFTQSSNNLPRDLVSDLVCDCNGTVWFSSSAHLLGGLGRYLNDGFKFYAPGNSSLPDNLIKSIACVGERIFVATGGTVTQQKVVEIDGNKWKLLPVAGYYLMDMDVDREGRVYVIDDVGLSSSSNSTNKIYLFDNDNYRNILTDGSWPHCLKTDLRNYLWVSKSGPENSDILQFMMVNRGMKFRSVFLKCSSTVYRWIKTTLSGWGQPTEYICLNNRLWHN